MENDFNFDSYLKHEIELTLLEYFNDFSGLGKLQRLHMAENLSDYELNARPHYLPSRRDDSDLLCWMNN